LSARISSGTRGGADGATEAETAEEFLGKCRQKLSKVYFYSSATFDIVNT
jgi:hypothetical protein